VSKEKHANLQNTAVVIITYNRPDYLQRTLDRVLELSGRLSVIVSQDGTDPAVQSLVQSAAYRDKVKHIQRTDRKINFTPGIGSPAYYHIAEHYRFALQYAFGQAKYDAVIIVEGM